jgi:DNA-binding IclR family transcriptional regulator
MSRERYINTSLAKALKILDLFDNERRELSLSDLARGLGLRPGSIYPIVYTLWRHGYLDRHPDTKRYRLGLKILVQAGYILSGLDIREQARPVLRRLVRELGGSATLSVLGEEEVIFVEEETNSPMIRAQLIGQRAPLHLTAPGKVFLAFVEALNPSALEGGSSELLVELEEVRAQGYAVESGEFHGHGLTVAAPVRDFRGEVVAALAVSLPKAQVKSKKKLVEAVKEAAGEVSQALGYRPKG